MGKNRYVVKDIEVAFDKTGNEVVFFVRNNDGDKIKDIMTEKVMPIAGQEVTDVIETIKANYPTMDPKSIALASTPDLMAGVFQTGDFIKGTAFFELSARLCSRLPDDTKIINEFINDWSKHYRVTAKQMKPFHSQVSKSLQKVYQESQGYKFNTNEDGRNF